MSLLLLYRSAVSGSEKSFLEKKVSLVAPIFQTERLTSQNGHVCVFSVLFLFWSFLILQMSCFNIFCLASILSIRTNWSTTSPSFLVTSDSSLSSLCLIQSCSHLQFSVENWLLNQIPNKKWTLWYLMRTSCMQAALSRGRGAIEGQDQSHQLLHTQAWYVMFKIWPRNQRMD